MIAYRILRDPAELEAVVSLQLTVWGLNPRNAVPTAVLHVMALNGGLVVGAYDGDRLVGLLISLAVKRDNEVFLWSHMTGTHPDYQQQGIGLTLKTFQRNWALDNGYTSIGWTFDPLQRGNAWFNLHLLGIDAALTSTAYHVNFYGDMDDDINRGLPSDRVEVRWMLDQPSLHQAPIPDTPLIVRPDERGYPVTTAVAWDCDNYSVAVPADLDALRQTDRNVLLEWRLAVREAMKSAFERGYRAVDFSKDNGLNVYHLRKI